MTLDEAANIVENTLPVPEERLTEPALILISGLPGTGKTRVGRLIAQRLPSVIVESDYVRKLLFPTPTYTGPESGFVYGVCHAVIERLLARGVAVVFDATNLVESKREVLYSMAERLQAKLVIVRVTAPPEVVLRRLDLRKETPPAGQLSDADWEVYLKLKPTEQRIRRPHFVVDTSRDFLQLLHKIVKAAAG